MWWLKYEHEVYEEEIKLTPPVDSKVKTPDGTGIVKEISPLVGKVKVIMDSDGETIKEFHRDNVTVIGKKEKGHPQEQQKAPENQDDAPKKSEGGRRRSHHSKGKNEVN